MEFLKFATIGSVDDGKSTLIGRLLFETNNLYDDQIKSISVDQNTKDINFAHVTDGLKAEREQGITIDVAYRYFSTEKRKFMIVDCPGHIEYTRNMITGTSQVNLALVLVDARHGIVEQTKRHIFLSSLMGVKHLAILVNKLDLENYSEEVYSKIVDDCKTFLKKIDIPDVRFMPISALKGDNIISRSENMPWYKGIYLLELLNTVHISSDENLIDARFPVQLVSRSDQNVRSYVGTILSGSFRVGEKVKVLPSGMESQIKRISNINKEFQHAMAGDWVNIELEGDVDISRGDLLCRENNQPTIKQDIDCMICWLDKEKLNPSKKYLIKHLHQEVMCIFKEVLYKISIESLNREMGENLNIGINEIGRVKLRTTKGLICDSFKKNNRTGSFIIIDRFNNQTVAAGMIL